MFRIGHGYDVHKLCFGRVLTLGGVIIEHKTGLLGHSDADVLTHAIIDSLIGAMGKGDIGSHFPDTDEKYKGISSLVLLKHTKSLLDNDGYKISNIDATIIAQRPKLASYIHDMKKNIADVLEIDESFVNIKATTEEKLGFTGREEGIAAHSVCLICD